MGRYLLLVFMNFIHLDDSLLQLNVCGRQFAVPQKTKYHSKRRQLVQLFRRVLNMMKFTWLHGVGLNMLRRGKYLENYIMLLKSLRNIKNGSCLWMLKKFAVGKLRVL